MNQEEGCGYGDGVAWKRGSMIGKGGYGSVYLASLKNPRSKYSFFPSLMAVKSAEVSASASIQKEREVLSNVKGCPHVIRCYGEETTLGENGVMVYNLLLEYGDGGTLADRIKNLDGMKGLEEDEVKGYVRSLLRGLSHVHGVGYVHCDLKPDNVILVKRGGGFRAKIGDFGLAKRAAKKKGKEGKKRKLEAYWRGTPMYLSPEAVVEGVQEEAADVWALGCIVLEMLTGKPPWGEELDGEEVLGRIGVGSELPRVAYGLSKEAKDFLKGCFVRNPSYRWTAEMLLHHPFVEGLGEEDEDVVEEFEEVEDLNEVESILLISGSDDELLVAEEWEVTSEDESYCYWSEDDEDGEVLVFDDEGEFEVSEIVGAGVQAGFDQSVDKSREISSQISPKSRQHYPVSCFTIPAGV